MSDPRTIRPVVTDELLINPDMGFTTYQRFNGDPLWTIDWGEQPPVPFPPRRESHRNPLYPQTSIAYCRWFWDVLEPEQGQYRWDIVDQALALAHDNGQTLQVRFMPQQATRDLTCRMPRWYQEQARGFTREENGQTFWQPDYWDPKYLEHWGNFIRAVGQRYDGHPWIDTMDLGAIGFWGEWHIAPFYDQMPAWGEIKRRLIDVYLESFRKTKLLMLIEDIDAMGYATSHGAGWRADCFGDLGLLGGKNEHGDVWSHMADRYPRNVFLSGSVDAWKHAPVSFETCGVFANWERKGFDIDFILEEGLRWHVTSLNAKSSPIPEPWMPKVERFMKRMGYRFVPRQIYHPVLAARGTCMPIEMWWVNEGVAPQYRQYILALQLAGAGGSAVLPMAADITRWMPGDDVVVREHVPVPRTLPPGTYALRIGLLHPSTMEPAIQLPIKGRTEDHWHEISAIEITASA